MASQLREGVLMSLREREKEGERERGVFGDSKRTSVYKYSNVDFPNSSHTKNKNK